MNQHTQGVPEWVPTRDGRRLYAMALPGPGGAAPTVVFEAGSGASRSSWAGVQPTVAGFARAIVYDRSGLGRSAPDPAGRTLDRLADDLADVLDHFGPGPFVLVGHSAGGPIVRLAASRRPGAVAGLVLVDPADEAADVMFTPKFRRREQTALRAGRVLARLGLLRFLYRSLLDAAPADDVRADLRREAFGPGALATQTEQARTFLDELETWRTSPPDLGDIPVTVVSGGLARAGDGMPEDVRAQANAAHALRAGLSPRGRHVVAEHSGHYVPVTEPGLIADEIERLVLGAPAGA
ncbi:alpha/beta fold hydrolase [Actinomadura atramentaria]|uniref:alpha/beta fold hydrolase n=1 Tax=Actinomadura atramentaria TaxID=1990 RepID=UPI00035D2AAE|nr:alpha/beta hydrolase [Actinomadura atramentaria]